MSNVRPHKERALLAPTILGFSMAPMAVSDAEEWAEYATLPEATRFTSTVARSAADIVSMIERTLSGDPNAPVLFSMREPSSGRFVASVGFHTVSSLNRTAEVTYTVRPEFWGKGLATAACTAAVRWAFQHKQWVRVQATTLEEHVASQRVLLKCGFALEGKLRNFRIVRGEPRDFLLYACIPAEA
jgi:RimJ/RimL family protein N-acetyltransferase